MRHACMWEPRKGLSAGTIEAAVNDRPSAAAGARDGARGSVPGETVRIVRFNVKPDQRVDFERFPAIHACCAGAARSARPVNCASRGI